AEGVLTGARALLIIADPELLNSPNIKRLLAFYAATDGAEAKVVLRGDFEVIAERNAVPKSWVDFGIYNNSLLYVTENDDGRFTKNEYRVDLYLRLFETIWNSGGVVLATSRDADPGESLTLRQLLDMDKEASQD